VAFVHRVRVRYGECDMQGVVFNAHYLAYVDDATDTWFRAALGGDYERHGVDVMLKKAVVDWRRPLRFPDEVELLCSVSRWGTASFDVTVDGVVGGEDRFTATITYVCVGHGTTQPMRVPPVLREALDGDAAREATAGSPANPASAQDTAPAPTT
jgi:acyl-CoA thioester hydrolase